MAQFLEQLSSADLLWHLEGDVPDSPKAIMREWTQKYLHYYRKSRYMFDDILWMKKNDIAQAYLPCTVYS